MDLVRGLKQDSSPPGPESLPLSSERTCWVVAKGLPALTAQGFGILEVTS